MNAVLLASKFRKKNYDTIIKDMLDFSVITTLAVAKGSSAVQIESLNPHCVIIDHSVKFKDIDLEGFICLIKLKIPDVRLIYNYGKVEDVKEEKFQSTLQFMIQQRINDIIIDDNIKSVLEKPMKFGDVQDKIEKIISENEQRLAMNSSSDLFELKTEKKEEKPVELNFFSLTENYKFDINNITEIIDDSDNVKSDCVTIALIQLQHHLGCTKTAFDMARYLYSQMKKPCIVMTDINTYNNILSYYKLKSEAAAEGISVDNIHVLPYSELENARTSYTHIILDIGFFRPEYETDYRKSDVKIMMCSAAEWDLIHISRWLNYPKYDYTRDINYLFSSSQRRYMQLSKSLLKGNCTSNRLDYSDETYNKKVYELILKRYDSTSNVQTKKRKLMKLR